MSFICNLVLHFEQFTSSTLRILVFVISCSFLTSVAVLTSSVSANHGHSAMAYSYTNKLIESSLTKISAHEIFTLTPSRCQGPLRPRLSNARVRATTPAYMHNVTLNEMTCCHKMMSKLIYQILTSCILHPQWYPAHEAGLPSKQC